MGSGTKLQRNGTAGASKNGLTARSMKATGRTTRPTVKGDLSMQMETCMKETGRTTRLMGSDATPTAMAPSTLVTGTSINSTEKEKNHGQMGQGTKVCTTWVSSRDSGSLFGLTARSSKETLRTTISTARAPTLGPMAGFTQAIGSKTKCTAEGCLRGRILADTKVSISKIKSRD